MDGGDAAKPGKNKNYVKPMGEGVSRHSDWRQDLNEYILDPAEKNDMVKTSPKNSDDAHEENQGEEDQETRLESILLRV